MISFKTTSLPMHPKPSFHDLCDLFKISNTSHNPPNQRPIKIPPPWQQGRTAYGGLLAGLAVQSAENLDDNLPPLRSIMVNFIGPTKGDPIFEPRINRRGKNVTSLSVGIHYTDENNNRQPVADINLIYGSARQSSIQTDHPSPKVSTPTSYEDYFPPEYAAFIPQFFHNFDLKWSGGARPMSGAKEAMIRCWARHKDPRCHQGTSAFVCFADILPPAAMTMFTQPGMLSTISWTMNILRKPKTEDGWWHVESRQTAALDGYSSQTIRIWNSEGALIADALQQMAIFV